MNKTRSARVRGQIRRSQLITTYGIGALVALGDESFMVAGLDSWANGRSGGLGPELDIHEARLEHQLGVERFVAPPATESGLDVPVVRFPRWYYCPECRLLNSHDHFTQSSKNRCSICGVELVPSRFVIACSKGHIDDFPYFWWVHGHSRNDPAEHDLKIISDGRTASLAGIVITCRCGLQRSMDGAFSRDALKGFRCWGRRPWLRQKDSECDERPRVLQRGASNVWFSVTRSALSIPPWSDGAFRLLDRYWEAVRNAPEDALPAMLEGMNIARGTAYSVEDLVEAVRQRKDLHDSSSEEAGDDGEGNLREAEFEALSHGRRETSPLDQFVCVPALDLDRKTVGRWFSKVMLVKRLREVRALTGFSRIQPPDASATSVVAPLFDEDPRCLPAMEVLGEGVFFELDRERLKRWEEEEVVAARVAVLDKNYRRRFADLNRAPDRTVSPRLVLVHTLAHALINQWALDCGYPAASLRERLYVSNEYAGLLIYTASGDCAGSLGGVVAQATAERLVPSLRAAIASSAWCSSDPLCIESDPSGTDALNLAACHACVLLPETSCEENNSLLDRALLVGTPEDPTLGFFASLVPVD
jgi:hypothetical protein